MFLTWPSSESACHPVLVLLMSPRPSLPTLLLCFCRTGLLSPLGPQLPQGLSPEPLVMSLPSAVHVSQIV